MVSIIFFFLFYVHTGYIDTVYQNCLIRIAEKDKADFEKTQPAYKKRKALQHEKSPKRAKMIPKHKGTTKSVREVIESSLATNVLQPADHTSSETNEDPIVTYNCHVTQEISDSEEDDGHYHYKGSWQGFLTSECKKIKMEVLSFGLLKESVPGDQCKKEQNGANTKIVNDGLSTETKKDEKKKIGFNSFECKIELIEQNMTYISEMLIKESLFRKVGQSFIFILPMNIDEESVMTNSKCTMSCYSYFEHLENVVICYKTLQMMYILFMTKWLLVYDEFLDCWILKKELLPIHVYFSECYVYVMWKLKYLTVMIDEKFQEIYKKRMLDELKYFCIILDLHKAIETETKRGKNYKQLIAYMYYKIEHLRNCISDYLQIFHSKTCTMSFYVAANKMGNITINIDKPTTKFCNISSKRPRMAIQSTSASPSQNVMVDDSIATKFYYRFHFGRYKKRTLFILAFTADFESIENKEGGGDVLTCIVRSESTNKGMGSDFSRQMSGKTPFLDSVDDIIEFFIMLKELKESDGYFLGNLQYYKKKRIKIWSEHNELVREKKASTHKLNAYREAILMSMGVNILDLIEDNSKDQKTNAMGGQEEEEDEFNHS